MQPVIFNILDHKMVEARSNKVIQKDQLAYSFKKWWLPQLIQILDHQLRLMPHIKTWDQGLNKMSTWEVMMIHLLEQEETMRII